MFNNGYNFGNDYGFGYGDYSSYNQSDVQELLERVSGMLPTIFAMVFTFCLVFWAAFFVFKAIGLYRLGRTCGLSYAWMGCVPVLWVFALGGIAEKCPLQNGRKPLPYRVILLVLETVTLGLSAVVIATFIGMMQYTLLNATTMTEANAAHLVAMAMPMIIVSLILLPVSIALTVFQYIALYRVYKLFAPGDAVLYTVLSILINVSIPIILFILRNRQPMVYTMPPAPGYYNAPASAYTSPAQPYAAPAQPVYPSQPAQNPQPPETPPQN